MRIGFDIRPLIFTKAGISTYLYNLIVNLAKISKEEYFLFNSSKSSKEWNRDINNVKEIVIRLPHLNKYFEEFWQEFLLPIGVKKNRIDIFHGPRFFVPRRLSCPSVVTIHDLAFKRFPQFVTQKAYKYFDDLVESSIIYAKKIIVPSETTKKDLIELYDIIPEDKIVVIYEGVDEGFSPRKDIEKINQIRGKYSLNNKFILYVGTIEPRKNLANLLEAYNILKIKDEFDLVITGSFGWLYESILEKLKKLNLQKRVVFIDYVPKEELPYLYNSCNLFVFPSFYEGFGLPVLEALKCGVPVVASNTSSLKELYGDVCYLVDPYSPRSIAEGIEKVLSDDSLSERLKAKGLDKSKEFSWDFTAKKTLDLYKEILS